MKTNNRWFLAFLSSCCLAVGLVRAADKLDPMSRDLEQKDGNLISSAANCTSACYITSSAANCTSACYITSSAANCTSACYVAENDK